MQARNPFTTLTNLSFQRNVTRLPPHRTPSPRTSYSSYSRSYFPEPYIANSQLRLHQQQLCSQLMGAQSLRYAPPVTCRPLGNSQSEYYNVQNCPSPTILPQCFATPRKDLTRDMFGSEYFNSRIASPDSPHQLMEGSRTLTRKPTITRKDTFEVSRFKRANQMKELSQLCEDSEENCRSQTTVQSGEPPETLFLKSRQQLFYRYHENG